jgi:hypothetical protein
MSTTLSPVTEFNQLHIDTTRPAPSTVRVAVVGEIDLATAPTLHDRLLTVLHEQAAPVDKPRLQPPKSGHPSLGGSSPASATQPPDMKAA